jgi:hypothetical protein
MAKDFNHEVALADLLPGFNKMCVREKINIISSHRRELALIDNPEVLKNLCYQGFYNALPYLMAMDENLDVFEIFCSYYGRRKRPYLTPNREEEKELLKYAAKRMRYIKFLREETYFFLIRPALLRNVIYDNAPKEVLEYLVNWIIKKDLIASYPTAKFMFAKADADLILRYIKHTHSIGGNYLFTIELAEIVFARQDLNYDQKEAIIIEAIHKIKATNATLTKCRQRGFIK